MLLLLRTLHIGILLCGLCLVSHAQLPRVTRSEAAWALLHPFAAIKLKRISREVSRVYQLEKHKPPLDGLDNGGTSDAYRHAFFMAGFAQHIGTRKLRRLGRAHEKANYRNFKKHRREEGELADSLSMVMDLWNNELGFELGSSQRYITLQELSAHVIRAIQNGEARIMRRNNQGSYLDCNGNVLDIEQFKDQWQVPKCLVPSGPVKNSATDRK